MDLIEESANSAKRAKVQPDPSRYWFFTWNNWEKDKWDLLRARFDEVCTMYCVQAEVGASGTPHLQGKICLEKKGRWSQFNDITKSIHWERSYKWTGWQYCKKDETHVEGRWAKGCTIPKDIVVHEPYGWQLKVMEIINKEPDDRTIHWFWSEQGNIGKTHLAKYLVVKRGALVVGGKHEDAFRIIAKKQENKEEVPDIIIFVIPRATSSISYIALEQIKDGLFASGKYDSQMCVFNCPHVLVFANCEPNYELLSSDRWKVIKIDDLLS